jgi:anti-sigma regulatory factor (Ser/Thr protein kinase)
VTERLLLDIQVASVPGNDRLAAERVVAAVRDLPLDAARSEKLRTAVAEAALNAIEHGNHFDPDLPVGVRVVVSDVALCVTVSDNGVGRATPAVMPDLAAKLRGEQSPRGWGLFLIRNMVDDCSDEVDAGGHRVHLRLKLAN